MSWDGQINVWFTLFIVIKRGGFVIFQCDISNQSVLQIYFALARRISNTERTSLIRVDICNEEVIIGICIR